jgi:hypothetical protein
VKTAWTGLVGTRLALTWAGLVAATMVSWWLGAGHGSVVPVRIGATLVLLVAYVKVWFVGAEFMELRSAPPWLRWSFRGWLAAVGVTTLVLVALV